MSYLSYVKIKHLFLILFVILYASLKVQAQYNAVLKKQLDSILVEDQRYRTIFTSLLDTTKTDSLVSFHKMPIQKIDSVYGYLMEKTDASNLAFVESTINKYGYVGKSMVGEPTNEAMWYVIQHSDHISKYFDAVKKAGKQKEIPMRLVAMMQDRSLVQQNKKQVYGTQVARRRLGRDKEETMFVWPVKNSYLVNHRRKKAGFETTVQQNAKRFHIEYKKVRLKDIQPFLMHRN